MDHRRANLRESHYRNVYQGVDLTYYGTERQLEYDFVVAPGADPARSRWSLGTQTRKLLRVAHSSLRSQAVQRSRSANQSIKSPVARRSGSRAATSLAANRGQFAFGAYDRNRTLVIDPVLDYLTHPSLMATP